MSIPTCAVRTVVLDSVGGLPLAGAIVSARLSSYELYQGFVVPRDIEVTSAADGSVVLPLFPNELGSASSFYDVKIIAPNGKTLRTVAVVPNQETAELSEISEVPLYEGKPDGAVTISQVQGLKNQTQGLRDQALGAADSADANAVAALTYRNDANNSKTAAAGSAFSAATSESIAALAAVTAVARAEEAVSAADTALAITNRRADTETALADESILNGHYFSTPSQTFGEAAIIWRKLDGVAVDTTVRVPGTGLVPVAMARETGYAWALVDSLGRASILVDLAGKVSIPSADIPQLSSRIAPLEGLPGQVTGLQGRVTAVEGLTSVAMAKETGYAWALVDSIGRAAMLVSLDGAVVLPKVQLGSGVISRPNLDGTLSGLIPKSMAMETGYAWALVDSVGRIGLAIRLDGTLVGKFPAQTIGAGSVAESMLSADLVRQAVPHVTDVVAVRPDDWHGGFATVALRTPHSGSLWERFPSVATDNMRGLNATTFSLQFRRSAGLLVRGKRDCGAFSPGAVNSSTSRGTMNSSTTWPPVGTFTAGDYYVYVDAITRVIGAATLGRSDIMVYDGAAWQYQAAPPPFGAGLPTSRLMRDWWTVSAAGTFDGVAYAAGDRIVNLGFQSMSGFGVDRWYKGATDKGELYYKGEFDPAGGLPASPAEGLFWQSSAAGVAGGFTFTVGDYLVREFGAWGQVPSEPITTVAAGAVINLRCSRSDEWEVRRTDKSTTRVGVQLNVRRASAPRRALSGLALWSDSMYGVSSVGTQVIAKAGRTGVVNTFGGGTSSDVAAMMDREVGVLGDRYRGWVHGIWMGQNNQPGADPGAAAATVRWDVLRMAELIGARDSRFYFKSILGQRVAIWNGSRIVVAQHEDMLAKTGGLYALEQWYATMFPGQWFSTRLALLAAAGSTLDPTFPGMTERQVADTYGIVPFSFFLAAVAVPVLVASLVYRGTWSTAGLPTGGAANDYYIRTGAGTIGSLVINSAGTWVEPALDVTHLSPAGADALSTFEANFINANLW